MERYHRERSCPNPDLVELLLYNWLAKQAACPHDGAWYDRQGGQCALCGKLMSREFFRARAAARLVAKMDVP